MKGYKSIFHRALIFALFPVIFLVTVPARATITEYASRDAFDAAFPSAELETWEAYEPGTTFSNGTTHNGITYNSSNGNALVTDLYLSTTDPNTLGESVYGYFGNPALDSITFVFSTPILAFGIDISTTATADGTFRAITDLGDVFLSYYDNFPDYDPPAEEGQFLGFASDVPFSSVTIDWNPEATPASFTLDTLRYQSVPLPPSLLLLGSGLVGLGFWRRRKLR